MSQRTRELREKATNLEAQALEAFKAQLPAALKVHIENLPHSTQMEKMIAIINRVASRV
jgi:Tfp pilus assembly protein PilO